MNPIDRPESGSETGSKLPTDLSAAIDRLWNRFLPEMLQRLEALEVAAAAITINQLTVEQRKEAHAAAHKLAGTLGTFNLARGTDLAREFECIASIQNAIDSASRDRLIAIATELRTIIENRK